MITWFEDLSGWRLGLVSLKLYGFFKGEREKWGVWLFAISIYVYTILTLNLYICRYVLAVGSQFIKGPVKYSIYLSSFNCLVYCINSSNSSSTRHFSDTWLRFQRVARPYSARFLRCVPCGELIELRETCCSRSNSYSSPGIKLEIFSLQILRFLRFCLCQRCLIRTCEGRRAYHSNV